MLLTTFIKFKNLTILFLCGNYLFDKAAIDNIPVKESADLIKGLRRGK
jgi:hypothetical protein